MQSIFSRFPFLKTYLLPLIIGIAGIILISIGLVTTFIKPQKEEMTFDTHQDVQGVSTESAKVKEIIVDVEGSIMKPGIYHLSSDARVQDALNASGGLSQDADRTYLEKKINLAAKLVDGGKIYVPHEGEFPISNSQFQISNNQSQDIVQSQDKSSINSIVNINEATADQLDALPGIGKTTAAKIINARPYNDIQELLDKKIVSSKVFTKIKDLIAVN